MDFAENMITVEKAKVSISAYTCNFQPFTNVLIWFAYHHHVRTYLEKAPIAPGGF